MRTQGIILCAGSSTRMGRPKALLPVGRETFLSRITNAFAGGGVDEIRVVVGGPYRALVEEYVATQPGLQAVRTVLNPDPTRGPLSSIQAAIADLDVDTGEALLIHPVDIPGLQAEDVAELLAAARRHPDCSAIVPSVAKRRAHPVLVRRRVVKRILALDEGQTLRDVLRSPDLSIHYVERENPLLLDDVDTPEDYRGLLAKLGDEIGT